MQTNGLNDRMIQHSPTPPMINTLARQIDSNCQISDANHAGAFSICGLALRFRDLYKWTHDLAAWQEGDSTALLDWIGTTEEKWETLFEASYQPLSLNGATVDLFDTNAINADLIPQGFFYGAGLLWNLKPTFFLAPIEETLTVAGRTVYLLGRELARDMMTLPATHQGGAVVVRTHSAGQALWDEITYLKKSGRPALKFALARLGLTLSDSSEKRLNRLIKARMSTYIRHEIGEMLDTSFDRQVWQELVATFVRTPVELLARSIKDLLADTHPEGALPYLIEQQDVAALGLYAALIDGFYKQVFPEFQSAFNQFMRTENWDHLTDALHLGRRRAEKTTQELMALYHANDSNGDLKAKQTQFEQIARRFV